MCGIAGLFSSPRRSLSVPQMNKCVADMTQVMGHRGPDDSGLWSDPDGRCVLGHRRLSIIDTSIAGAQPMVSDDGHSVVTFNGEIYNYLELKPKLEARGRRLKRRSDTEVLLEGLSEWGIAALQRFDGMFAFASFDTRSGELLLARDPFGEKPLYYTTLASGAIAFASELQALERCPGFDPRVDVAAMAEVLSFQYAGAPRCIYGSVKKLPPGHWMRIDGNGNIAIGRYFAYEPGKSGFSRRKIADLADELEDILVRSISRRMISDVPLGAFLSGGVDSSTVCAIIRRRLKRPLKTFSIGFLDAPESEHLVARGFAQHLDTEHFDQVLTPDTSTFLRSIGARLDEPNADSSCLPTFLLSSFAREQVTVAISGDGGDEMFGGYGRYFTALDEQGKRRVGNMNGGWTPGAGYYGNLILVSLEDQIEEMFGFVPEAYADHLAKLRKTVDSASGDLLCEMRRTDAENYMPGAVLPKVDRMSMQCSLEVRTPFLTTEVARFAERLPDSTLVDGYRGKLVLREIAYRYLPRDLVDLPKKGFGLPLSDWARNSMLEVASDLLGSDDSRLRFCFGPAGIDRFLHRQQTPGRFSPYQVWAAAMLESWLRHHPVDLSHISGPGTDANRIGARREAVTCIPDVVDPSLDLANNVQTSAPVNFRRRDPATMQIDVDYALQITRNYKSIIEALGLRLDGLKLLELGPGINFGPPLLLASLGADVALADRFLAAWDPDYHPHFYAMLAERFEGPKEALLQVIADQGYARALTLYPEAAETLETTPDAHFDLVLSNAVLEHVVDLEAVAKQMARITKPGGKNSHQVDFRDHHDFDRPLEFLLVDDDDYLRVFLENNCERGNRIRPSEAHDMFETAGFTVESYDSNMTADRQYMNGFVPRLKSSSSRFSTWPEADLHSISGRFSLRRR